MASLHDIDTRSVHLMWANLEFL